MLQIPEFFSGAFNKFNISGELACACSGGIDSLALTVLAAQGFKVVALIIDHNLRPESKSEAAETSEILSRIGIKNVILRNRKEITANLQEAAREIRYKLLTDYCRKAGIGWLATAHHADDNAETFLLRLSRGSGVDGLSGIADCVVVNEVKVIRPVLRFTKLQLREFLQNNKIEWIEDPSNKKDIYKRNKLRQALDSLEDRELITARINDAAMNLARVREFLELETDKAFAAVVKSQGINVEEFAKLHDEIAYRVLVKVIMEMANPDKKPRFEKLKRLKTDLLAGKVRTLNGLIFRPKNGIITIAIEK